MTFSENLNNQGGRQGRNSSDLIMRALYTAGPPAIVVAALAMVVRLGFREDPWQAFRGFTAFFVPVVLGAYVLRRWPEWLRRHVSADDRLLTLIVPFVVVLLVGGSFLGESSLAKWILGLGFLGLLIAVLFIVRIVEEPEDSSLLGPPLNMAVLDIIVGVVTAAGILVLFRG